MKTSKWAVAMRKQLVDAKPMNAKDGYPTALRTKATALIDERVEMGDTWNQIGKNLGLDKKTVQRWWTDWQPKSQPKEKIAAAQTETTTQTTAATTSTGDFKVESTGYTTEFTNLREALRNYGERVSSGEAEVELWKKMPVTVTARVTE